MALVIINGGDVREDALTAGWKLPGTLTSTGLAARTATRDHDVRAREDPPTREPVIRAARRARPEVAR